MIRLNGNLEPRNAIRFKNMAMWPEGIEATDFEF